MYRTVLIVLACVSMAACTAGPEQTDQYRQACESYGHAPGSPELAKCIEGKARQGEAAANKVGTSVLTNVIIGAL